MIRLLPMVLLAGCFTSFPSGVPVDGGVSTDGGELADRPLVPDPDDGVPPTDRGVADDGSLADGEPRADGQVRCESLQVGVESLHLRAWAGEDVQASVPVVGLDCPGASVSPEDAWLQTLVSGADRRVLVTVDHANLPTGRHESAIELRLGDQRTRVPVTLDMIKPAPPGSTRHVLVIGVDGLRGDALPLAETPTIDWLARQGAYTPAAWTQPSSTASAAGWTSFFTGVGVGLHQVQGEDFSVREPAYWSFISLSAPTLRQRGGETLMAYSLDPLYEGLHVANELNGAFAGETSLNRLGEAITARPAHLAFAHVFNVDDAGQATDYTLENPAYLDAVGKADALIGGLVGAVLARPTVAQEEWLFVMSADNGGSGDGDHGSTIPLLVAGTSIAPQMLADGSHLDVHPTVLSFLGLDPAPWIEGRTIGERARESDCGNQLDDDGDGQTDCADLDCASAPECAPDPEVCDNDEDDDGDGDVDCQDADCRLDPDCLPDVEVCDNRRDDDGDGEIDCQDDDCAESCEIGCEAEFIDGLGLDTVNNSIEDDGTDWVDVNPPCADERGADVVYQFVAPRDGLYVFNTIGAGFDTVLSIYDVDCGGERLACNDDSVPIENAPRSDQTYARRAALVRQELAQGQMVAVAVSSYQDDVGDFPLNVHEVVCDAPVIEYRLPDEAGPGSTQTWEFNNSDRPTFFGGRCAGAGREVMWRWTVPADGAWQVDTLGSEIDTVLNLTSPDCTRWLFSCSDDPFVDGARQPHAGLRLTLEAGDEYMIIASGKDAEAGDIQLNLTYLGAE